MAKKVKKKVHIKILPILILLLVIGLIYLIYSYISKLPITNIYITGNNYLSDQEIIELANIENYPSFLLTTSKKIKTNISKNSLISKVRVTKNWWGIVNIEVEEHNILFRQYNDEETLVLDNKNTIKDSNYRYQVPKLLNYVPDNKYNSFIKGMNKVNEDVKLQISEITYVPNDQDKDRFLLYMNDGNYVYLTLTKFKQINYYEDILKKLKGSKGILYLDSGNHFKTFE